MSPYVLLSNLRLSNIHLMTVIEGPLSLLELFDKCSKREYVIKLSIMTKLDLSSVDAQKLGVWDRVSCY